MSEALPIPGRASCLRASFNQSLIDSLTYFLDVCRNAIPENLLIKAQKNLGDLKPEEKLSGFLSVLHFDFFQAIEKEDISRITKLVEKLSEDHFQVAHIPYMDISTIDPYYKPLVESVSSQEIIDDIHFFPLTSEQYTQMKDATQKGCEILERSFPDYYAEFQELVSEILFLNAKGVKQGSSADLFGLIYKSYLHNWEKVTSILEFLIHEQSHLYLFLLNKDDPLVLNPMDFHESPLRKEKRPLMGIYHATFVLARVSHVLKKALELKEIPDQEKLYCEEFIGYYDKRFDVGFNVLQQHANMTPLAHDLIASSSL